MAQTRKPTADEKVKIEAAIAEDNVEALEILFSKTNIDINADLGKWTAIHWAVWSNKINCVKTLVMLGANVYAVDTNGETPLKLAVDKEYEEIVYYFVKVIKQDTRSFNEKYQFKIKNIIDAHIQSINKQSFQAITVKDAQKLTKYIMDAKKNGYTLKVRYSKVLVSGSTGAGKSSFVNLLLNKKINQCHISTGVAESQQIMVTKKLAVLFFNEEKGKKSLDWTELNFDKEISQLKLHLFKKMQQSSPQQSTSESNPSQINQDTSFSLQSTVEEDIVKSPTEGESLSGVSSDVWDVLTLLDAGGQPQFINMLPAINSSAMTTFIVHNMRGGVKSLSDKVAVTHGNEKGERSFSSYSMQYTNLELIKVLMSLTNDTHLRNSQFIDSICAIKGETTSYLSFIGTHADLVTQEEISEIDQKLSMAINETKTENVWKINDQYEYLIPVNNTTAGSENEDENAGIIRAELSELQQKRDVYDVPITWIIMELEIQKQCQEKNCSYISYSEVCNMCRQNRLFQEEELIKDALRFHHSLGVLLYFEKVQGMNDFVITNHQWLFNRLTKLVCYTFQGKLIPNNVDLDNFKYEGILSTKLIPKIGLELGDIKIQYFLNLLIYLGIIVPIEEETGTVSYFMPSILPTYTDEVDKHLQQYGSQTVRINDYDIDINPLLIQFSTGTLPRGVFCCLAVQLLQDNLGWKLRRSEKNKRRTFTNLITFRTSSRHSISLIDKVFYLEIQIRHKQKDVLSVHYEFQCAVTNALATVSANLNLKSSKLWYGFWCQQCPNQDGIIHMTKLSQLCPLPQYCDCDHDEETKLTESHTIWLQPMQKAAVKQQSHESTDTFLSKKLCTEATTENNPVIGDTVFNPGVSIDVPGVSNLTTTGDCHRLLWQELNKIFGNASTSIFVMAAAQQLNSFDFDITHEHAKLADQKAFVLVDRTLSCGINYSPTGSSVSGKWERLLEEARPRAGHAPQPAFENTMHALKQELKKDARSVVDYKEYPLEYYNVSLQPSGWYQWFDSQYEDKASWEQINVSSENDNAQQADLYRKLSGDVHTSKSEKHSNVNISLKVRAVEIIRPWLDLSILNNESYTIDEKSGSWSTGELSAENDGRFALLSTRMIVAKDLKVTGSTEMFSGGSNSNNKNNTVIIGYVCTLLPKFPH